MCIREFLHFCFFDLLRVQGIFREGVFLDFIHDVLNAMGGKGGFIFYFFVHTSMQPSRIHSRRCSRWRGSGKYICCLHSSDFSMVDHCFFFFLYDIMVPFEYSWKCIGTLSNPCLAMALPAPHKAVWIEFLMHGPNCKLHSFTVYRCKYRGVVVAWVSLFGNQSMANPIISLAWSLTAWSKKKKNQVS